MFDKKMLINVCQIGFMDYMQSYNLQTELLNQRINGEIEDTLLLLEHPPVVTIGKSGKLENVLTTEMQFAEKGISVFFMDRGGDVTYHGPGQLVGYPILDIGGRGRDLHQYVHNLEEVLIRTLGDFGINAFRDNTHPGVWVGNGEIAAIGLKVKKWVSMHGFALNINTDLEPFSLINPCGFADRSATSMSYILSQKLSMATVTERLIAHFAEIFNAQVVMGSALCAI
jgi:lipoate-protein ligase B